MSETAKTQHIVAPYCQGNGVDLGSGGFGVTAWAIQFDRNRFGHLTNLPVHWVCDIFRDGLPFKDKTLDYLFSSHLLEDIANWHPVLEEWGRVVKIGGHILIQVPDKTRFREAVRNGQDDNLDHQHESYVGELTMFFQSAYLGSSFRWHVIMDAFFPADSYNILFIAKRTA